MQLKHKKPLTASLPGYLKDPANFMRIQKMIYETIATTCLHSEIGEMALCKICTENMLKRRKLLKKLGFKNPAQYFAWKRVHEEMISLSRDPLVNWKEQKSIWTGK